MGCLWQRVGAVILVGVKYCSLDLQRRGTLMLYSVRDSKTRSLNYYPKLIIFFILPFQICQFLPLLLIVSQFSVL